MGIMKNMLCRIQQRLTNIHSLIIGLLTNETTRPPNNPNLIHPNDMCHKVDYD